MLANEEERAGYRDKLTRKCQLVSRDRSFPAACLGSYVKLKVELRGGGSEQACFAAEEFIRDAERHKHGQGNRSGGGRVPHSRVEGKLPRERLAEVVAPVEVNRAAVAASH